ncbi:MAG: HNH endonuclease [bacterium]
MASETPKVDPYLFERQYEAFQEFVESKSNITFVSFASNPYTDKQESYKYKVYRAARDALSFEKWHRSDIGTGDIAEAAIAAIEINDNNLVSWQGRYGKESRPHHPLYQALEEQHELKAVEDTLFKLYRETKDEESFVELVHIFGKRYPILAYLFFIKDRSRYLPIAPTYFDVGFQLLGVDFKTTRRCSWGNYITYIKIISKVKDILAEHMSSEVSLLDAHSFIWMLSSQMQSEGFFADVQDYLSLPSTEREAVIKARVGQGRFRNSLIEYWSSCAVTGCAETALLRASHIKPWAAGTLEERLSLYNGLLLSPMLDACFDSGYISFADNGDIMISNKLSANDVECLGLHSNMKLRRIEDDHKQYLKYHRENIFK